QFLSRRELWSVKAPLGMAMQFLPPLVGLVDRQKERRRIGNMDKDGQIQRPAGLPDWIETFVIDRNQRAVRVFVFQAELLEDFDAAGAALFECGELGCDAVGKIGAIAVPGCRIVGFASALP